MEATSISRRHMLRLAAGALALPAQRSPAIEAPADVLVLGAGMAGLHAARLLQSAGLKVRVLEASGRVGGRCWTARDVPGRPELGASQIGPGYGRVRGNAAELGVPLIAPPPGAPTQAGLGTVAISVYGQPARREPWATSALNRLAPQEQSLLPLQLFSHYIDARSPLKDLGDWLKPEFAALDRMSLREYLAAQGASPEALRLLNVNVTARNLDEANALDVIRKNYFYRWEAKLGPSSRVQGGMSTLTDAMAASLQQPVQTGRVVRRIEARADGVSILCQDGSRHRARACITTIPLSVMKDIAVDAPVPAAQRQAWRAIRYGQLVQVFMNVGSPFWEKDGMAPELWSDGPIERVLRLPSPSLPHGLLVAFINGEATDTLDRLPLQTIGERTVAELVRLRPAAAGAVTLAHVHNWTTQPFARGHIAGFAPGDIARFEPLLARPVGALYFAGEHCAKLHAGIEAACESAEAAVLKLMEDIGKA